MRALHSRWGRFHDLAAGRAGTFHEIGTRHSWEAFEISHRILNWPVDHAVDDQAMSSGVDVRDPAVVTRIVQAGRRNGPVAVLQRRISGRLLGKRRADFGLELRA